MVAHNGEPQASAEAKHTIRGAAMLQAVASGMTITDAAKAVGVSRRAGSELYHAQLAYEMERNTGLRQHMIAQDLETLRLLLAAHMPLALGTAAVIDADNVIHTDDGDVAGTAAFLREPSSRSAKIVLSVLDRRSKLMGLDAAVRVEVSNARINDVLDTIVERLGEASDTELAEVLQIDRSAG